MVKTGIKIATIDLYNNERNEGMRCIREIANDAINKNSNVEISYSVFDTRFKCEIPGMDNDIFISSGGPGSPFEGEGTKWEKDYFNLLDKIFTYNQNNPDKKKYIFFICHSFQMMARFFKLGLVNKRYSKSFGVMPFNLTDEGMEDIIFKGLPNTFYAADIRQYQVIEPDDKIFNDLDAKVLSYEAFEENKKYPPALAAVRISDEIAGTQFHPEADTESMLYHFKQDERKKYVVEKYGEEKFHEMITLLEDHAVIKLTRKTVIPSFINNAIEQLSSVLNCYDS